MNYKIIAIPNFKRQLKRLAKKFPSLKNDLEVFTSSLRQHPRQGTALGNSCYKVRMAIASKGKGKSGGARVITYWQKHEKTIYLLSIYDKSAQETIPEQAIVDLLHQIP